MPHFRSGALEFHYADVGHGLPFVFQHGLGGDTQQTLAIFPAPTAFRMLTLDCRGHGQTQPLGDPAALSFDTFADDVLAMIDQLGLDQVAIGGISMGAGVALNFALRYPERLRGLVLVRPAWLHQPMPANLQLYPQIAELLRRQGPAGQAEFAQSPAYQAMAVAHPAGAVSVLKQFERPHARDFADVLERLPYDAPDRQPERWSGITAPVLVLGNDRDPVHPYAYAETLAAAIPGARLGQLTSKETSPEQHNHDLRQQIEGFLTGLTE